MHKSKREHYVYIYIYLEIRSHIETGGNMAFHNRKEKNTIKISHRTLGPGQGIRRHQNGVLGKGAHPGAFGWIRVIVNVGFRGVQPTLSKEFSEMDGEGWPICAEHKGPSDAPDWRGKML